MFRMLSYCLHYYFRRLLRSWCDLMYLLKPLRCYGAYGPLSSMAAFHGNTYKVNCWWTLMGNRKPYYHPPLEVGLKFLKTATDWQEVEVGDTCRSAAGPRSPRSVQSKWVTLCGGFHPHLFACIIMMIKNAPCAWIFWTLTRPRRCPRSTLLTNSLQSRHLHSANHSSKN